MVYKYNTVSDRKYLLFFCSPCIFKNSYIHTKERKTVKEFLPELKFPVQILQQ